MIDFVKKYVFSSKNPIIWGNPSIMLPKWVVYIKWSSSVLRFFVIPSGFNFYTTVFNVILLLLLLLTITSSLTLFRVKIKSKIISHNWCFSTQDRLQIICQIFIRSHFSMLLLLIPKSLDRYFWTSPIIFLKILKMTILLCYTRMKLKMVKITLKNRNKGGN